MTGGMAGSHTAVFSSDDVECVGIDEEVALLTDPIDPSVLGVMVLKLHESVAYHDVVVLVGTHEAGYDDLTGETALITELCGFGTEHGRISLTLLHILPGRSEEPVALEIKDCVLSFSTDVITAEEVCFTYEVCHELADGMVVDLLGSTHLGNHTLIHDDDLV